MASKTGADCFALNEYGVIEILDPALLDAISAGAGGGGASVLSSNQGNCNNTGDCTGSRNWSDCTGGGSNGSCSGETQIQS